MPVPFPADGVLIRTDIDAALAHFVHRPLQQLFRYWEEKRRDRPWPSRGDIDPVDFAYALGHVSLVDVLAEPLDFRFRVAAGNTGRSLGTELTGKRVSTIANEELRDLLEFSFRELVETRAPFASRGQMIVSGVRFAFESLILPLGSADRIEMILSAHYIAPSTEERTIAQMPTPRRGDG